MKLPSINIGLGNKGHDLIEYIDNHFGDHESILKELVLSSSLCEYDDTVEIRINSDGNFKKSEYDDIKQWFEKELYAGINNLNTIRHGGDPNKIIVNIVAPIFNDEETLNSYNNLLTTINELINNELITGISIKVFSVIYSLGTGDIETSDGTNVLSKFSEITTRFRSIIHDVYYIDDRNIDATILNLDEKWLAFALSEFFIFQMFEPTSLAIQNKDKVFGLSVVHFNEVLFRKVISLNVLRFKLQQEKVNEEGVDVEDIIRKTNPFIESHSNFLTKFIEKFPADTTNENNLTENVKQYISDFKESLESFLTDKSYTVAEAKVILANIIGEDDDLLTGVQWSNDRLNLKDLEFDIIEHFNKYLPTDEKIDRKKEKELRQNISDLQNGIKREKKILKEIEKNTEEIESDMDISFEDGVFNVNGKRIIASGYIPSPIDPNDEVYQYEETSIPKQIDLSTYWNKVKDQGQLGSCSAFPIAAVYEFAAKYNEKKVDISELFIYYNSRKRSGHEDSDSGSTLIDSIRAVREFGACYTSTYPYNIENFTIEPTKEAYDEAKHQVVDKAVRVKIDEKDFKHAVYNGYPVIFGLKIYESFYPKNNRGLVPYPSPNENLDKNHGHHAMLIVGYNDDEKLFKVRNSWGTQFGDNGYCYIPYDYLTNPDYCTEAFIITEIADLSYDEFSYSSGTSFSFLNNLMLKKKVILEHQIREKNRELNNIKEHYNLIVAENESNIERIKDPVYRKNLYNRLQDYHNETPPVTSDKKKKKNPIKWIVTGAILFAVSFLLLFTIPPIGIIVNIAGLGALLYGLYLKLKNKDSVNTGGVTGGTEVGINEVQKSQELYKFRSADTLFDELETFYNDLIKRYKSVSRYYELLKSWQNEIDEQINDVSYETPTFVFNLVDKKTLNNYINSNKETFIRKLDGFMKVFYEKADEKDSLSIEEIFDSLKEEYLKNINKNIDRITNISVIKYLLKDSDYDFFNEPMGLDVLCPSMLNISKPFCNLRVTEEFTASQHFVLREELEPVVDNHYNINFKQERSPSSIPIEIKRRDNQKKLTHIQIAALDNVESIVRYIN